MGKGPLGALGGLVSKVVGFGGGPKAPKDFIGKTRYITIDNRMPRASQVVKKPKGIVDMTPAQLGKIREGMPKDIQIQGLMAPRGIGIQPGMTSQQQRAAFASQAVAGTGGVGKSKSAVDWYRNLVFTDLMPPGGGSIGMPTGIEKQYVTEVLGQSPLKGTGASFLSALERAYGGLK